MPVKQRIITRNGTAAQWTAANPILAKGEKGFETDTLKEKAGDGVTAWNALGYAYGGGGGAGNSDYTITTVGTTSSKYATDGTADNIQLQQAINDLNAAGGGIIEIVTPITIAAPIVMKANVTLRGRYEKSTVSIASNFAGGVAFVDQSGLSTGLTMENIKISLSGKTDVGGVHIYKGDFVRLTDIWVDGQGYTSASKWAVRIGHYTDGDPAGLASHGTVLKNLRITNCNCGTYEQLLFVNQQDARIEKPYFEGNTNSLAYELMLYINNKNVVVDAPHFENSNAHSIGAMESERIFINDATVNMAANFKVFTIINTQDVIFNGLIGKNTVATPTTAVIDFFDRTLGPDGFVQIVDDTNNVRFMNMNVSGWKSFANAQTAGTVLGTAYTMNQYNIFFQNIVMKAMGTAPFAIGIDNAANFLHDWEFDNIQILGWNGTNLGAFQLRGYLTAPAQVNRFRFNNIRVVPSSGVGANASIRAISMAVQYVLESDLTGTFTSYGALSTANGGVIQRTENIYGLDSTLEANKTASKTIAPAGVKADYNTDGTADNIEIQAAINAVAAAGGGTVFLRSGLYRLAATLSFPYDAKVKIVGEKFVKGASGGVTLKTSAGATLTNLIEMIAPANPTSNASLTHDNAIEHMALDGNNTTTNIINFTNADYCTLNSLRFIQATNAIKTVWDSTSDPTASTIAGGLRINDCVISANSGIGIDLQFQTQCWITNTWFTGTSVDAWINIKSSNKIHLTNCEFNTANTAIRFQDTATFPTTDITINDCVFAGGKAWTEQRTNPGSNRISIVGSTLTVNTQDVLVGTDNVIVNSNGARIKNLTVSDTVTATSFIGDGSGLTNVTTADATTAAKGAVQLAGDLGGTSTSPKIKRATTKTIATATSGFLADYYTDGIDDQVQIQQALTAVAALGGGQVTVLEGAYSINAIINMPSNVDLIGINYKSILNVTSVPNAVLKAQSVSNIRISGFTIDNNARQVMNSNGIYMQDVTDITVENNRLLNQWGFGIFLTSAGTFTAKNVWIRQNYLYGKGNNDVIGGGPANSTGAVVKDVFVVQNIVIQDSTTGNGHKDAINFVAANRITFSDNIVEGSILFGSEQQPHKSALIQNNVIKNAIGALRAAVGFVIDPAGISTGEALIISGNTIESGFIDLYSNPTTPLSINSIIANNVVRAVGVTGTTGGEAGIRIVNFDGLVVSGNSVYSSSANGIWLTGAINSLVTGNIIRNSTGWGIQETGVSNNNSYYANKLINNTLGNFSLVGAGSIHFSNDGGDDAGALDTLVLHKALNEVITGNKTFTPTTNSTSTVRVTKQDGTSEVFNIDTSNSRVGIGKASPAFQLDIANDTRSGGSITAGIGVRNTSGNTAVNGTGISMYYHTAGYGVIEAGNWGSAVSKIRLNPAGGFVGVGKDPTTAFDVNGTITATTFAGSGSGLTSLPSDSSKESVVNKGASNGYAPLGADSKVPTINLPTLQNLTAASTVKSESDMAIAPSVGTSTDYARADHTHGTPGAYNSFGGYYEDFMANATASPWLFAAFNSGTQAAGVGTINHPGVIRLASSATANSGYRITTNTTAITIGGGEMTDIIFAPTTPGGTVGSTVSRLGFHNTAGNTAPTAGLYMEIVDNVTSFKNVGAGTTTGAATTTLVTNTYYRLRIEVNTAKTAVIYTLYSEAGTVLLTETLTTNIPTASVGHAVVSTNSGTVIVALLELDFMNLLINRPLVR